MSEIVKEVLNAMNNVLSYTLYKPRAESRSVENEREQTPGNNNSLSGVTTKPVPSPELNCVKTVNISHTAWEPLIAQSNITWTHGQAADMNESNLLLNSNSGKFSSKE